MRSQRLKRIAVSAAATLSLTLSSALFASASPAQAAEPSCTKGGSSYGHDGGMRWAICRGTFKRFRILVDCEENNGSWYYAYGAWATSGGRSEARCHERAFVAGDLIEYRYS